MALKLWQRFKSIINPGQPLGYSQIFTGTVADTGLSISPQIALTCTTVNACVQAISTEIAKLPWSVISLENGRSVADTHPLHRLLRHEANPDCSALTWKELVVMSAALTGNGYSLIERGADGRPKALFYLRPDLMSVIRLGSGEIAYIYSGSEGQQVFTPYDIFHLSWISPDGLLGYSPISLARQAIGLAIAQESFGASYYRNASRPGGALVTDRELSDDALQRIRESWEARMRGVQAAGTVAILEGGLKWQPMSLSPEDSQWLQSRTFQREEICSIFRVPPSVLGIGQKASYASAEQANREWVSCCLSSWAARLEAEAQRKLLRRDEPFSTEISFDALLKTDLMTRYQTFSIARQFGFLSVNEIRAELGLPSIGEQGDAYLQPTNMVPASNAFGGAKVSPPDVASEPDAQSDEPLARFLWQLATRDCGTGAGGFKPGNDCAKGGGDGEKSRPDARALIDFILDPKNVDGFTVDPHIRDQPKEGIMVAIPGHELKISREDLSGPNAEAMIDKWVDDAWDEISSNDNIHVGGWYNAGDGQFYLDLSERFSRNGEPDVQDEHPRAQDALESARDGSQYAVFNLETFNTTWVKYLPNDSRKPKDWDQKYNAWLDSLSPADRNDAAAAGIDSVRSKKGVWHGEETEQRKQEIHDSIWQDEGGDEGSSQGSDSQGGVRVEFQNAEARLTRNCGTGAGGFAPGNDCAKGGGDGDAVKSDGASNWLQRNRKMIASSTDEEFRKLLAESVGVGEENFSFEDESELPADETDPAEARMNYRFTYVNEDGESQVVRVGLQNEDRIGSGGMDSETALDAAVENLSGMSGEDLYDYLPASEQEDLFNTHLENTKDSLVDSYTPDSGDPEPTDEYVRDVAMETFSSFKDELTWSSLSPYVRTSLARQEAEFIMENSEPAQYENSPDWDFDFTVNGRYTADDSGKGAQSKGEGLRVMQIVQASLYRMIHSQWSSADPPQTIFFTTPGGVDAPQHKGRVRLYNGMIRRFAKDFAAEVLDNTNRQSGSSWKLRLSRQNMRSRRARGDSDTIEIEFIVGTVPERRDCGTGAGGFKPGNDCAKGGGDGDASAVEIANVVVPDGASSFKHYVRDLANKYKEEECAGRDAGECEDLQDFENIDEAREAFRAYTGNAYQQITAAASGRDANWNQHSDELMTASESLGITQSQDMIRENLRETMDEDDEPAFSDAVAQQWASQYDNMQQIAAEIHARLNKETQKCTLNEPPPITLFRGMSLKRSVGEELLRGMEAGEFTSVAVQSWSKSLGQAQSFANGEVPVILVGRNFKVGLDVNPKGLSFMAQEREVIAPSARYAVTKITAVRDKSGTLVGGIVELDASGRGEKNAPVAKTPSKQNPRPTEKPKASPKPKAVNKPKAPAKPKSGSKAKGAGAKKSGGKKK